jgi:AraC-like DNA-binding protein
MSGISLHYLSRVLNQYKQQNFFDYINQLRIEAFKLEVVNPLKQHLSISGIAFNCGFNSKAAFNIAFRKYTGLTPSAYRKQAKVEES